MPDQAKAVIRLYVSFCERGGGARTEPLNPRFCANFARFAFHVQILLSFELVIISLPVSQCSTNKNLHVLSIPNKYFLHFLHLNISSTCNTSHPVFRLTVLKHLLFVEKNKRLRMVGNQFARPIPLNALAHEQQRFRSIQLRSKSQELNKITAWKHSPKTICFINED